MYNSLTVRACVARTTASEALMGGVQEQRPQKLLDFSVFKVP